MSLPTKESSREEIWTAMNRHPGQNHWVDPDWVNWPNVVDTFAWAVEDFLEHKVPPYKGHTEDRGIVICAGGKRLFTNAWVCINMLREHGVELPIQIWHLGPGEMDQRMRDLVEPLGVSTVDAMEARLYQDPVRILNGFEVKPFTLKNCNFKEVLLLDADNVPVRNPLYLFDAVEYREKGAVLWPDFGNMEETRLAWKATGVQYRDEAEVESGQVVLDRERSWKSICLTVFLNEYSDFLYRHVHGDKETFHLGFRRSGQGYAMPERRIHPLDATMCQHDFSGERVFQHRNMDKWDFDRDNRRIAGFRYEAKCLEFVQQLRDVWDGEVSPTPAGKERDLAKEAEIAGHVYRYERVGHDKRLMLLQEDGTIGEGVERMERSWKVFSSKEGNAELWISGDEGLTCRLHEEEEGKWKGRWENYEKMPVELTIIR